MYTVCTPNLPKLVCIAKPIVKPSICWGFILCDQQTTPLVEMKNSKPRGKSGFGIFSILVYFT